MKNSNLSLFALCAVLGLAPVSTARADFTPYSGTVKLRVTDHRGAAVDQDFTINVAGPSGGVTTWLHIPQTSLPSGLVVPAFNVMKYEARSGAVSTPTGAPAASITWVAARTACQALGSGYDIMKESQWLAIAHDAMNVAANWTGGSVGSGMLMRGNSDQTSALASQGDDALGYSGVSGEYLRRTLLLSTGDVIWDMAGNIAEWVYCDDGRTGCSGGGTTGSAYANKPIGYGQEFSTVTPPSGNSDIKPGSYTSANGIGTVTSGGTSFGPIIRGGSFSYSTYWGGSYTGLFTLDASYGYYYSTNGVNIGYRCVGP